MDLVASLLELILTKKTLIFLQVSTKYLDISNNRLINWLKNTDRYNLNRTIRIKA